MIAVKGKLDYCLESLFAIWLVLSVLGQHPERSFDRVRNLDAIIGNAAIPNWRFFAPRPAVHDVHFLYRLTTSDQSDTTDWRALQQISERKLGYIFWAPHRRSEKAVFDVASAIRTSNPNGTLAQRNARKATIGLIHNFARTRITDTSHYTHFQLLIVRFAGHDKDAQPDYDYLFEPEPL